jgi:hypothetical protein
VGSLGLTNYAARSPDYVSAKPPGTGHRYFDLEPTVSQSDDATRIAEKIPELKSLSPEEKLILVGELWDELAADPNAFPPREDHIKILRERLEHYRQHPEDVIA